jgi:hypothetical protein
MAVEREMEASSRVSMYRRWESVPTVAPGMRRRAPRADTRAENDASYLALDLSKGQ